jgi:hypothetical protein
MSEVPRIDVPARGENVEDAVECMKRVLRRPKSPRSTISVPKTLDRAEIAPLDFVSLDRACLPEGTFQICMALVGLLQSHASATGLTGPTESRLWVRADGRIVATAASLESPDQVRAVEEAWIPA